VKEKASLEEEGASKIGKSEVKAKLGSGKNTDYEKKRGCREKKGKREDGRIRTITNERRAADPRKKEHWGDGGNCGPMEKKKKGGASKNELGRRGGGGLTGHKTWRLRCYGRSSSRGLTFYPGEVATGREKAGLP